MATPGQRVYLRGVGERCLAREDVLRYSLTKAHVIVNLYYTTGNTSDVHNNVYYEADGPCVCIDVKTWMDLCCSDVNII